MNEIIALAVHDLSKREGRFEVKLAERLLSVTATTQRVIDEISNLYNRRASKSYGQFSADEHYPTQAQVRDYVADQEGDFLYLTSRMMETLRTQAQARAASTGGHVLFARFRRDNRDFLLVAIVNDRLSAALTSERDMRDVRHLDLDGFRFAGRVNLTAWAAGEERYISFLKGKGEVSEYFRHFLGCDCVVNDRADTSSLVAALREFVTENGMSGVEGDEFLGRAKAICDRVSHAGEELEFDAFANELMPRVPQQLRDHLADTDRRLSDGFVPDRRALASLIRLRGGTRQWKVEFERQAVTDGTVVYDAERNTLTIRELPDELVRQLREQGFGLVQQLSDQAIGDG